MSRKDSYNNFVVFSVSGLRVFDTVPGHDPGFFRAMSDLLFFSRFLALCSLKKTTFVTRK